jgi:hypothetical protein
MAKTNFVGSYLPIVKLLTFGRGEFAWGLDPEDNPLMKVPQRALRWLLVRPFDLGRRDRGRRSEMLVQRLRSGC